MHGAYWLLGTVVVVVVVGLLLSLLEVSNSSLSFYSKPHLPSLRYCLQVAGCYFKDLGRNFFAANLIGWWLAIFSPTSVWHGGGCLMVQVYSGIWQVEC